MLRRRGSARLARGALGGGLAILVLAAGTSVSLAHPLGNFTINHHAGLRIEPDRILVDAVIDMAEIPTVKERQRIDTDGDGEVTDGEVEAERVAACPQLAADLLLEVDGRRVELRAFAAGLDFPPGLAGLPVMRLVCEYEAVLAGPIAAGTSVRFTDDSSRERIGWREMVAVGDGVTIREAVPAASLTGRLTSYPEPPPAQPPDTRSLSLTVDPGGPGHAWAPAADADPLPGVAQPSPRPAVPVASPTPTVSLPAGPRLPGGIAEDLGAILGVTDLAPLTVATSMAVALALGAFHALSPGHGKTIIAAYLVGTRGTTRHALALGMTVTVSHTLGVLVLAILAVSAGSVLPPDRLYPFLQVASGVVIVAIGLWLIIGRLRLWRAQRAHEHDHAQAHDHDHDQDHDRGGEHGHGPLRHSHLPPGDSTLTWRSLFSLGLAGGLVPSTAAVVLLVGSLVADRPAYGLVLVIAFGVGMAVVLGSLGLLVVRASHLLERLPRQGPGGRLWERLPLVTAVVVVVAGAIVAAQAALEIL